jgi:hypothetical protein
MTGLLSKLTVKHWFYLLLHFVAMLLGLTFFVIGYQNSGLLNAAGTAVGTSMMAAGFTGWVLVGYVLLSEGTTKSLAITYELGLRAIFMGRGALIRDQYDVRLAKAKSQIDVMGFGERTLREDKLDEFEVWKARAKVRILLIDPSYPGDRAFADRRDLEEGHGVGSIRADVREFLQATKNLVGQTGEHSLEIRLYKCLPSINMFRIDDDAFWGPYLISQPSRNAPTFLVHRGGPLFDVLTKHFDDIWSDNRFSRAVEASDYAEAP